MIKRLKKMIYVRSNLGVSLIALIVAMIIMSIIGAVLITRIGEMEKVSSLNDMYRDIRLLQDKVSSYYLMHNKLPVDETETLEEEFDNPSADDNGIYYKIKIELLDNITLSGLEGDYIINQKSHNIYYLQGVQVDNEVYYTLPQ